MPKIGECRGGPSSGRSKETAGTRSSTLFPSTSTVSSRRREVIRSMVADEFVWGKASFLVKGVMEWTRVQCETLATPVIERTIYVFNPTIYGFNAINLFIFSLLFLLSQFLSNNEKEVHWNEVIIRIIQGSDWKDRPSICQWSYINLVYVPHFI